LRIKDIDVAKAVGGKRGLPLIPDREPDPGLGGESGICGKRSWNQHEEPKGNR
jgi:hypothetical protein